MSFLPSMTCVPRSNAAADVLGGGVGIAGQLLDEALDAVAPVVDLIADFGHFKEIVQFSFFKGGQGQGAAELFIEIGAGHAFPNHDLMDGGAVDPGFFGKLINGKSRCFHEGGEAFTEL